MKKIGLFFLILAGLQGAIAASDNELYKFSVADSSCGGFPKLPVRTFEGSCLGVVATASLLDSESQSAMRFPRKILELEPHRFLITDMGGWSPPNRGVLWELDLRTPGSKKLIKRAQSLYLPHDLQWGPDGDLYVGELGRVARYSKRALLGSGPVSGEAVVSGLPTNLNQPNLHPLVKFAFGKMASDEGDLFINVGAPTDACVKDAPAKCTVGENQGLIRKYKYDRSTQTWSKDFSVWARGLRNSMGLVFHSSGTFLQAENSRDFKEVGEPFDEINLVLPNRHYGWPYCYNFKATSPEWPAVNCTQNYESPYLLLPPHSAPLDMLYYEGAMFPQLKGHLLLSWHGYQPTGSRIVSYPTNEQGLPILKDTPAWSYNLWGSQGVVEAKTASPQGGGLRAATYYELVSGWSKREGARPAGAPVGMTVASDGSILIVEDKNKSVLILTRSEEPPYQDPQMSSGDDLERINRDLEQLNSSIEKRALFSRINQQTLQVTCVGCHSAIKGDEKAALEFLVREKWVTPGNPRSLLLLRVRGAEGLQRMPLGGSLSPEEQSLIERWLL